MLMIDNSNNNTNTNNYNYLTFFTATILEWKKLLDQDKYKKIIIESLRFLVKEERIKLCCFVIMPNHIHLVWKIDNKLNKEDVQRDFLKYTAQQIKFDLKKNHPEVLSRFYVGAKDREYQIWERNPLSVAVIRESVAQEKIIYIHNNPVREKWNLSPDPLAYKWTSARFYETGVDEWGFLTHYADIDYDE